MATYDEIIKAQEYWVYADKIRVTSTTGGTHSPGSLHYQGAAVDFGAGGDKATEEAFAAWLYNSYYEHLTELIHTKSTGYGGWFVKDGRKNSAAYGSATKRAHRDHVHVSIRTDAKAKALLAEIKKGKPTLREGMSGLFVEALQRMLHITVDGGFGNKTEAALKVWQKAHGLTADGVYGPAGWAKTPLKVA